MAYCVNKVSCLIFFLLVILASPLAAEDTPRLKEPIETISYDINPFGVSLYQDMGPVEFRGRRADLVIFKTQVIGFKDTETIYSDPQTYLPLWVERDLSMWFDREYLTEEYISSQNALTITKFNEGKKIEEYRFKGKSGPIHNAILLPFSLRKIPDLKIGWSYNIRLPDEFKVEIVSLEEVTVPAGKFKAYHFTSTPNKFEIWISADALRLPVKIKGIGGFSYTLMMKKHTIGQENQQAQ